MRGGPLSGAGNSGGGERFTGACDMSIVSLVFSPPSNPKLPTKENEGVTNKKPQVARASSPCWRLAGSNYHSVLFFAFPSCPFVGGSQLLATMLMIAASLTDAPAS